MSEAEKERFCDADNDPAVAYELGRHDEREACIRDVWSAEGESTPGMPGWCLKREIEAAIRARGQ